MIGLGEHLLNHVGGIDAGRQPGVEAQGDHSPQPSPVSLQEGAAGVAVSGPGAAEQFLGVGRGVGHGDSS